jgi:hypothetical protein
VNSSSKGHNLPVFTVGTDHNEQTFGLIVKLGANETIGWVMGE